VGQAANGGARRRRRRRGQARWRPWGRVALEVGALLAAALVVVVAVLGRLATAIASASFWWSLLGIAATVLALGAATAALLRGWIWLRPRLAAVTTAGPAAAACVLALASLWLAWRPAFHDDLESLHALIGGPAETQRQTIAHQVYAAYRRADLAGLTRVLERARVYEPTVLEAAAAFGVDPEVMMGIGSAESAFYPRDSADGGRGLFQITAPPAAAVVEVRRRLGVSELDALNQRHNAFVAAATLRLYLDQMGGDPFLGLLAYNIGPRNGGLRAAMEQYGARDFTTIQPYLQNLPRDYPIRVLSAALAYRLWRTEGRLPRYEEGDNARHIQRVGIPGLTPPDLPRLTARRTEG
jgi:soluble lytic murein transglycosylase-like protein